jgi:4-amino-4-deoxy-L-arabinose transferase-like glycosyltransferase
MLRRQWALVGAIALGFLLRVTGLGFQSLWRDEVDAVRFAAEPLDRLLHTFVEPGQNGPLYYLLLRPWLDLVGDGEFALRFFSAFWGVLAVPLIYRFGRRLFPTSTAVALLAALLAATAPYLVWYSQEGKMYALTATLVLLSMDRYLAALERGGWQRWLTYVVSTSAAFYVHLIAALIVPVQVLVFFLLGKEQRGARWKPWLASLAALTAPYLPLVVWQLPLLLEPAQTGYRFVPLHEMLYSLLTSYSLGVVQGGAWWMLALFIGLLLAASVWGWREFGITAMGILLCWLLLPVAVFFLITLVRPIYTARYLIFVLPAFLLLLAAGVTAVARRSRLLAGLLLGALLVANGWGLWLQATTPLKADFRAATAYVTEHKSHDDLVLFQIPYGRYSYEYYARQPPGTPLKGGAYRVFLPSVGGSGGASYRWAEGPYTNDGMRPGEVDRRMSQITAGSRVVWLVATEVEMWDERGLVQGWLDEHATRTEEAEFVRVTVYRYQFP